MALNKVGVLVDAATGYLGLSDGLIRPIFDLSGSTKYVIPRSSSHWRSW